MSARWCDETREELLRFIDKWEGQGETRTRHVADHFSVSTSTARRWLYKLMDEGMVGL